MLPFRIPTVKLRRSFWRFILACTLCVLVTCVLYDLLDIRSNGDLYVQLPDSVNVMDYPPFEPEVHTDLNFNTDGKPKIERIIHQTWKTRRIPSQFVDNAKTFVKYNPKWKYYLWTDESAQKLIKEFYPYLLDVWDGVSYSQQPIRRADALRYVVLYHYGGIYADLDVKSFRPLDNAITRHSCVFTPEPYEHSVVRLFSPYVLSNAIMLCSARHPFLKHLIDNLHTTEFFRDAVDSTGPGYITTQYMVYNRIRQQDDTRARTFNDINKVLPNDNSPYFYKGDTYPLSINNSKTSVYIANTKYFINSADETVYPRVVNECYNWSELDHIHRRLCVSAKVQGLVRNRHPFAFTDHQWHMTWNKVNSSLGRNESEGISVDIQYIAPNYLIYE